MKNGENAGREHAGWEHAGGGSNPEFHDNEGNPPVDAGSDSWRSVVGFRGLVWGASTFLFVAWCVIALGIGVNYAHTFWDWFPIMVFGLGVPAGILWQTNRVLAPRNQTRVQPSARDEEKELLTAFSERGELTAVTAAMRTSLTADEASKVLEGLLEGGHLRLSVGDGVQAYALPEADLREMPQAPLVAAPDKRVPAPGVSHRPLVEDLSERELEVLALVSSGRTNSEIAGDLFVAQGTVKAHVANIYRKLDVRNRAEALSRARELKLLP